MYKLDDFRTKSMFIIAAILIPLAYYLRDSLDETSFIGNLSPEWSFVVASIIFVLGATIANLGAGFILRFTFVRKFLMGKGYIEGYWILTTDRTTEERSSLDRTGIISMQYDMECRELTIETTRYDADSDREFITHSEVAYVRTTGPKIRYLNFFVLTHPSPEGVRGFSSGTFAKSDGHHRYPQKFSAIISTQDSEYTASQSANKIPDAIVKKYKKAHTNSEYSWMKHYIDDNS